MGLCDRIWNLSWVIFNVYMTLKTFSLLFALCFLVGCESKAGYSATFSAPKSKLISSVTSAVVYKNAETLVGNRGIAIIRICPDKDQTGKPLNLLGQVIKQNSDGYDIYELVTESGSLSWSWDDYKPLLSVLKAAHYTDLDEGEMKSLNHSLFNALSSPKGFVLKGQGKGIVVLSAVIDRAPDFQTRMPYYNWIDSAGLKSCDSS